MDLGVVADSKAGEAFNVPQMEYYIDVSARRKTEQAEKLRELIGVRALLLGEVPKPYLTDERKFLDWDNDKCLRYGEFLVSLVDPEQLNTDILINGARLGLGPGVQALKRRFESLGDYYRGLGLVKNNPQSAFEDWGYDDYVGYIRGVAALNDGQVSERILKAHSHAEKAAGRIAPSVTKIKNVVGKLSPLLEAAGAISAPNHVPRVEGYINAGVSYYLAERRLPTKKDFGDSGLPTTTTIHTIFGGIKNYQSVLRHELGLNLDESLETAQKDLLAA